MWYVLGMSEDNRTLWDQRKEDSAAYKKGVREGWDQAAWTALAICVAVFFIIQLFPD